jgi:hypothetical protein
VLLVLAAFLVKTAIAFFTYGSTDTLIRESVGALPRRHWTGVMFFSDAALG